MVKIITLMLVLFISSSFSSLASQAKEGTNKIEIVYVTGENIKVIEIGSVCEIIGENGDMYSVNFDGIVLNIAKQDVQLINN